MKRFALSLAFSICGIAAALAAPVLKSEIAIDHEIVTVGDMFDKAGPFAERALFRAPAPGTAGNVGLRAIRAAMLKAGIDSFDAPGIASVRVARNGVALGPDDLSRAIAGNLGERGLMADGHQLQVTYDRLPDTLFAAMDVEPLRLTAIRYNKVNGAFAARFEIAGMARPLETTGRITFNAPAPHLIRDLAAGTVIGAGDVEMRMVPANLAEVAGPGGIEDLVGMQLRRTTRAGTMLRTSDVAEPVMVNRNELVTMHYVSGPLTITVKGRALNDASAGETVAVLNLTSKKTVHGTAFAQGAVRVEASALTVAGL